MVIKLNRHLVLSVAVLALTLTAHAREDGAAGDFRDAWGRQYGPAPGLQQSIRHRPLKFDAVRRWNDIALDANALDHTPVAPDENRIFGEQLGPGRTSRALAIVHIAIFDAVNAITGHYRSYTELPPASPHTSMDAAIAQGAHDTLVALYPSQTFRFDQLLGEDLSQISDHRALANGIDLGRRAAAAILALRAYDGSQHAEPRVGIEFIPSDQPGWWRPDPISQIPLALGAYWGRVTPFVLESPSQLPRVPPPALASSEYAAAFNEVKRLGGDGVITPTRRTQEQTIVGIYWAYDGTPGLGTPPRLYNQIAVRIADERRSNPVQLARLLALVNVAMADAGIACWEAKYLYQFWRPVTGIREADEGTGPTGLGDGNPDTKGDPTFTPLGAPASNLVGPNFTPPFPAYASGHATFGSALFQILRNVYRSDEIAFNFVSDEFNGVTKDNRGNVRPLLRRRFSSLSKAEQENAQSRIYLGIHWAFDQAEGITHGRQVADYVFEHAFVPLHGR